MTVISRSIRKVLDPFYIISATPTQQAIDANVNSSLNLLLVEFIVEGRRNFFNQFPFFSNFQAGCIALAEAGDNTGIYPVYSDDGTNYTGTAYPSTYGAFPDQHNIDISGPPTPVNQTFSNGKVDINPSAIYDNKGLRNLANTVQYGKGATQSSFSLGLNFMTGGTNLPAVLSQNGAYVTSDIAMSDFYGVRKEVTSSNLVNYVGFLTVEDDVDEQVVSSGDISIGDNDGAH